MSDHGRVLKVADFIYVLIKQASHLCVKCVFETKAAYM